MKLFSIPNHLGLKSFLHIATFFLLYLLTYLCLHLPAPSPKIVCWNSNPKGDSLSRYGLRGVTRSWLGILVNGISALLKRSHRALYPLPLCEDTTRGLWPEEGSHLTLLAPWSQTSSLQNCEQQILLFIRYPVYAVRLNRLRHIGKTALMI